MGESSMEGKESLRRDDRGASIIAVLVALVFVGTIALIVTDVTWTNIRMREVELSGKKNFYTAENVLDELSSRLDDIAADAAADAYSAIMKEYRTTLTNGESAQKLFNRRYMDEMKERFMRSGSETASVSDGPGGEEQAFGAYYDVEAVKRALRNQTDDSGNPGVVSELEQYVAIDDDEAKLTIDYEKGDFRLYNVAVDYTDQRGYRTTIKTDMVFHAPVLNYNGDSRVSGYMKYALIADDSIKADAPGISVSGSIYAGAGGIETSGEGMGETLTVVGNDIVTRGDIVAHNGSSMSLGNGSGRIWAENIETLGEGSEAKLTISGSCYIADDLTLGAEKSTVTLSGNYYGYNFLENYDAAETQPAEDAAFSSAIVINGTGSTLDMSGLDYLLLAGRTYISRGAKGSAQNNDIPLGESLSVRTNQLAYYVPDRYLARDDDGALLTNGAGCPYFSENGAEAYVRDNGLANGGAAEVEAEAAAFLAYLNETEPITTYFFRDSRAQSQRYYLNFKDEQSANDFFDKYWESNSGKLSGYGDSYADAIEVGDGMLCTLKGDMLSRTAQQDDELPAFQERRFEISPADWASSGVYWDYARQLALNYKCLELGLKDSMEGVTDLRFHDASGGIDKTADPLFANLLDVDAMRADLATLAGLRRDVTMETESGSYRVVVTDNANAPAGMNTPFIVPNGTEGIVVATGDVFVEGTFRGMIISGGTITFASNASVTGDERLVSELFSKDMESAEDAQVFAKYFADSDVLDESVIGVVQADDYSSYENWTRNED